MEYATTYGWAILIILIVGVVLWQMRVFDIQGRVTPGSSGFSGLVPIEWSLTKSGGSCSLNVMLANGAGEDLTGVAVPGEGGCVPGAVLTGDTTICQKTPGSCPDPGGAFEEELVVEYRRASDNQSFQTAGTLWGSAE